jgi:hypothetical protein
MYTKLFCFHPILISREEVISKVVHPSFRLVFLSLKCKTRCIVMMMVFEIGEIDLRKGGIREERKREGEREREDEVEKRERERERERVLTSFIVIIIPTARGPSRTPITPN